MRIAILKSTSVHLVVEVKELNLKSVPIPMFSGTVLEGNSYTIGWYSTTWDYKSFKFIEIEVKQLTIPLIL